MSKTTKTSEAGDSTAGAASEDATKTKAQRVHLIRGVPYPVVKSHYDPKRNRVIDHVQVTKQVQTRRGDIKDITLTRKVESQNEALQAKYYRDPVQIVEVPLDVE